MFVSFLAAVKSIVLWELAFVVGTAITVVSLVATAVLFYFAVVAFNKIMEY